jgi:DNA-binding transcriptional ArsR family regulator
MPLTLNQAFTQQQNRLATVARALGHPARIAILQALAQREACVCGELVELLPLAQATVSQHLKELKQAGLIQGQVEGTRVCYCLNPEGLAEAAHLLAQLQQAAQATDCGPMCC